MVTEMEVSEDEAPLVEIEGADDLSNPYTLQGLYFQMGDQGNWAPMGEEAPIPGTFSVGQQLWTTYRIWVGQEWKAYQK